jgi:hypothetical protein
MKTLTFKILEYLAETNSVLVSYASDETEKTVDDYPPVHIELCHLNASTAEEYLKEIARAGKGHVENILIKENFARIADTKLSSLIEYVGKPVTFNTSDFIITPTTVAQLVNNKVDDSLLIEDISNSNTVITL